MYKNYLLLTIGFAVSTLGFSQGCPTNLFFSEYIEGSSNNKILEIYNPLPYTVDLNDYVIERYTNGSTTVSAAFFLGGSVASGDTYVICNGLSSPAILAISDTISGVLNFNGDDAMVLKHEFTFDTLDIIGKVGVDPGSFWAIVGGGTTENQTLVRKSNVGIGTTDWILGASQWNDFPLDYIDSLGTHYCTTPSNSYNFQNFTICSNDSILIQSTHYESLAGIYYDTLTAFTGCDSVIITELFLNQAYLVLKDTSSCPGDSLFIDGDYQTVPGIYSNNYTTTLGCDSIIEYNYTFFTIEVTSLNETICEGDSIYLENGWQYLDGLYTDIYTSVVTGCDSLVETTLTINTVNVSVTEGIFDLTANATGVTYQWAECDGIYTELLGETNMQFIATNDGYYSVEITDAGCVDTSDCFLLAFESVNESTSQQFLLYPNPASSKITLDLGKVKSSIVEILNVDGKLIQSISITEKQYVDLDLTGFESGIYLISVTSENEKSVLRFVKE